MSNRRTEGKSPRNGSGHNGHNQEISVAVLEKEFDIIAESPEQAVEQDPLSLQDICDEIDRILSEDEIYGHEVSVETDDQGRTAIVVWNVNPRSRQQITTVLARKMTFQAGSLVERINADQPENEVGMALFVYSVKGHGKVR